MTKCASLAAKATLYRPQNAHLGCLSVEQKRKKEQWWSFDNLFGLELSLERISVRASILRPSLSASLPPSLCSQTGSVVLSLRTFYLASVSRSPQTQRWLNERRGAHDLEGFHERARGTKPISATPFTVNNPQRGSHGGGIFSSRLDWVFLRR